MTRDEIFTALGQLEHLTRIAGEAPTALDEFHRVAAALKETSGAGPDFLESITRAEACAAELFRTV